MSFLLFGLTRTFIEIRKMIKERPGTSSNDYFILCHVLIVVLFYTSYAVMAGFSMRLFDGLYWSGVDKDNYNERD
jgi:hypothetical protein